VIRLLPRDRGLLEMEQARPLPQDEAIMTQAAGVAARHDRGDRADRQRQDHDARPTMLSILNEPTRKILTIEDPSNTRFPASTSRR
jgi:general secretion pathway protein E